MSLLNIKHNPFQIDKLVIFLAELEKWNKRFHFIKAQGKELIIRHFFDSLAGIPLLNQYYTGSKLLDIGSGVGFPGVPLSIIMNKSFFTLCERGARRAAFLRNISLLCNLQNVKVEEGDFAALTGLFDVILFRAFSRIKNELPAFRRILNNKGIIFAYKGTLQRIIEEIKELATKIYHIKIHPLSVPFLKAERHIIIINNKDII